MSFDKGFSLLEALFALLIFSLLAFFGYGTLSQWSEKSRLEAVAADIQAAIRFARLEAIALSQPLNLAPSHAADWSTGMVLFVDNESHVLKADSKRLREWHWAYPSLQVDWYGFESKRYLVFSPHAVNSRANGHFLIRGKEGVALKIVVNRLGRARMANTSMQTIS